MSYFMLDDKMAQRTNLALISPYYIGINDIYSCFEEELKSFLQEKLGEEETMVIKAMFNRKLVKSIFMPLIYGKKIMSTYEDLRVVLSQYVTPKESFNITRLCFQFWTTKYARTYGVLYPLNQDYRVV